MARDKWKKKYLNVRAELKRARQLASERGDWRDRWRAECEAAREQAGAAQTLAQQRLQELEQPRADELEEKKYSSATLADGRDADHAALVLKRRLEDDPQWSQYIARLSQVKSRIRQTIDACRASPSLRPKARYMNLESLLKWSRRILDLLDRGSSGSRSDRASGRAELRYGWLRDYRTAIEKWSRWEATVRASVSYVRTRGLSADTAQHHVSQPH